MPDEYYLYDFFFKNGKIVDDDISCHRRGKLMISKPIDYMTRYGHTIRGLSDYPEDYNKLCDLSENHNKVRVESIIGLERCSNTYKYSLRGMSTIPKGLRF